MVLLKDVPGCCGKKTRGDSDTNIRGTRLLIFHFTHGLHRNAMMSEKHLMLLCLCADCKEVCVMNSRSENNWSVFRRRPKTVLCGLGTLRHQRWPSITMMIGRGNGGEGRDHLDNVVVPSS